MRISELVSILEKIKAEDGDLEIYAEYEPNDPLDDNAELAEFGIISRVNDEDEILLMDVYPQGELNERL